MKNENLITEADKFAKALNQYANAIGNLCKAINKAKQKDFAEGGRVPNTSPLSGIYNEGLFKKFYEVHNAPSASFMAATFVLDEKVIEASIKAFDEAVKKYAYDDEDKKYPDYICTNDFTNSKKGDIFKYNLSVNNIHTGYIGYINITSNSGIVYTPEYFEYHKEYFEIYKQQKQTFDSCANDNDKIEFYDKDGFAFFVITKSHKFWQDFQRKKNQKLIHLK
jgi:hypothetical protein